MASRTFLKKASLVGLFTIAFSSFFFLACAGAQAASAPQFLITWKTTGSYIPSFYQGKALPTYGSTITASLELVSPQGEILNLGGQTIYWYLDDNLVGGGIGIQKVTFSPLGQAPNSLTLRVTLPHYNGAYLVHAVRIPMVLPRAVIYAPYPNGDFSQSPVSVTALPFFFNVSDPSALSYAWSVNGQNGANTENPEQALITLPQGTQSGTGIAATLNIKNSGDSTAGTDSITLTYQSQL